MMEMPTSDVWRVDESNVHLVRSAQTGKMVAMAATPEDARLIAESPALYAIIKNGLLIDTQGSQSPCPCRLCQAGRAIVARVEGNA